MENVSQITWYDVNEKKPESDFCILIHSKSGGVAEGHYTAYPERFVQYRFNGKYITDVTHWAYLPEAPKTKTVVAYDMINRKIDKLIEQGVQIHYDREYETFSIDKVTVEHNGNIFIDNESIDEYIIEENPYMVEYLYEKLDKAFWEQKRLTPEEIVKYLED